HDLKVEKNSFFDYFGGARGGKWTQVLQQLRIGPVPRQGQGKHAEGDQEGGAEEAGGHGLL
nr:hypothetical protein [Leptospiraceae bacterium]